MISRAMLLVLVSVVAVSSLPAVAADHGDAPAIAHDRGADINDVYAFLDPNDNSRVVVILTTHGFIAAGENNNFSIFDPLIRYRLQFETTGDFVTDQRILIKFSERTTPAAAQTATVKLRPSGVTFTAPATNPTLAGTANPQVVTTNAGGTGIDVFAGPTDDPFFFDIPGFARFVASILDGPPADPSQLDRGRDSFAGYNTMAIALRIPVSQFGGADSIGIAAATLRKTQTFGSADGLPDQSGSFRRVDRAGNPAVNVALIPFPRKNIHNISRELEDAAGKFDGDIQGTCNALGTSQENCDVLLSIAANNGDYLRLSLNTPNVGTGGGDAGGAGFPASGRRLRDDVIDVLLNVVSNGAITAGDNVNANDLPFQNTFPFLAPAQQPRVPGTIDDNTRN